MTYIMVLCCISIVGGLILVASNPSPFFAAFSLVLVAGAGCAVLVMEGGTFLALVLFLIYLGGMLVVFGYSTAMAAEPYPEAWMGWPIFINTLIYATAVVILFFLFNGKLDPHWTGVDIKTGVISGSYDTGGIAFMYSWGGGVLVLSAWVLLLALFAIMELTRGLARGGLRLT